MRYTSVERFMPGFLRRYVLDFEARIEDAVTAFAAALPEGALVLDAGAGEARHAPCFPKQRYIGVDLAVGDPEWDYGRLNALADLSRLPFPSGCFDGCLNIVTLEHVREPRCVLSEIARALKPGGRLLLIVPHEWEVHQAPHDYFRFTRYGARYLLEQAGFAGISVRPAGGYFRLLARRLLNGLRYFRPPWVFVAAVFLAPPALILPLLDPLDRDRDFTLGYICTATKPQP
jgi:SAM-dependent methyltransferase